MGRYISTTGTASTVLREISSAYNAEVNDRIIADSTGGAFTVTLPANSSLLINDTLQIIDAGGAANTQNITLARNGSLINGSSEDLVIDVNGAIITLLYTGSTYGWVLTSS